MWRVYPPTPDLIVHADWGSHPSKRWMCWARNTPTGVVVDAPVPVGDLGDFWTRVHSAAPYGYAVVGFDFPIGVPNAYARRAGVTSFRDTLPDLGEGRWSDFYAVCEEPAEISLERPFYPFRPGGTKRSHLVEGLGVDGFDDLHRACERRTEDRAAASSLFWTLGGKQVGRAAIIGWRDLIAPGLRDPQVGLSLWPFDGPLIDLLAPDRIVVVETYPAEACVHLGIDPPGRGWSKTSQEGRAEQAERLFWWAERRRVRFDPALERSVKEGFGSDRAAEDPFDAVLGALSMVEVCFGSRTTGVPDDPVIRSVEGWILGLGGEREAYL